MKAQIEAVIVARVVGLDRLVHGFDELAKLSNFRCAEPGCQFASHIQIHHRTHLEDLQRLFDRHVAHENAAVFFRLHQSGFLEHAERLPHRSARYAELVRQRGFGELGTGIEFAVQDHAFDLGLHQLGERIALQLCDGGMRETVLAMVGS